MSNKPLKAPRHLKAATRRWWLAVVTDWTLEEHHVRLLTAAAEAWDRKEQAREQIAREGLTVPTKEGGARLHPAVRVETDARLAFARLLRELDLDVIPPAESKRPPALRSIAR
jgi:P27 family predicted phage terminase small subunit